jgi:hypothetical protein
MSSTRPDMSRDPQKRRHLASTYRMDQDPTAARCLFTNVTPDRDPPPGNSRDPLLHYSDMHVTNPTLLIGGTRTCQSSGNKATGLRNFCPTGNVICASIALLHASGSGPSIVASEQRPIDCVQQSTNCRSVLIITPSRPTCTTVVSSRSLQRSISRHAPPSRA